MQEALGYMSSNTHIHNVFFPRSLLFHAKIMKLSNNFRLKWVDSIFTPLKWLDSPLMNEKWLFLEFE
jgi:hypothetical protein